MGHLTADWVEWKQSGVELFAVSIPILFPLMTFINIVK